MNQIPHQTQNQPKIRFNLQAKMITLISILIIGIFIVFSLFLHTFISNTTEDQVGKRAISVAKTVAMIPELKEAFQSENPAVAIQEIAMPIQEETEAEFIVIGNTESVRYFHPDTEKIGQRMVGEDNDRALLYGESYISEAEGSLGESIRGKTPVYSHDGEIIGIVSVGFMNDDVQEIITEQNYELWLTISIIILLGIIGAIMIATYIKKLLFNLEPEEISNLMIEKESILQSTHEGIIAIDNENRITMINTSALHLLQEPLTTKQSLREDLRPWSLANKSA